MDKRIKDNIIEILQLLKMKFEEEFKVRIVNDNKLRRISINGLEVKIRHNENGDIWDEWITVSTNELELLLTKQIRIIRINFVPEIGDKYYFLSLSSPLGYESLIFRNDEIDNKVIRRSVVYETEEEVDEVVYQMGWND